MRHSRTPMRAALLLLLFVPTIAAIRSVFPTAAAAADPDRRDLERVLKFLSDDRLAGRGSFTEGNAAAARFIAAEFTASGLRPAPGCDSLITPFTVTRVVPESVAVTLDGQAVPPSDLIVSTEAADGAWTLSDSFPVVRMGQAFDREMFRKNNCLILVPRIHEKTFQRYRRFLGGPRTFFGPAAPGALVAILTDSAAAGSMVARFRGRSESPALSNVVGVIPGKRPNDVLLFSAHYDHLGIVRPVDDDSIANGANDNASGTTALIGLAKYFSAREQPERTLVFAALAAEEIGGFGARRLLEGLNPDSIAAMVNIEMVGTVSKFGPRAFWITGYERSSLGELVSRELEGTGFTVHPDPYPDENLFFRSDNALFARAGVPAHSFSTNPIDLDTVYHTVNDEFDRLDPAHLTEIVRGLALGVQGIVDGRQTPGRLKLE